MTAQDQKFRTIHQEALVLDAHAAISQLAWFNLGEAVLAQEIWTGICEMAALTRW